MTQFSPTETALLDLNTKLRSRIAELERKSETDEGDDTKSPKPKDVKDYKDTSDDDFEPDPDLPGKVRPKKKPVAADDEDQDEEAPKPSAASIAGAKVFALAVVNAGARARGLAPLKRLSQDEQIVSAGTVPATPEAFARATIDCARKARGLPPLKPGEFISIRELRGGR
jgi:hypothetical protein